jgi:hypothetical protein
MPNCDFYALPDDCREVLDFIFRQPGWLLHEHASAHDSTVRIFDSVESIMSAFQFGDAPLYFQLHAPEMKGRVVHQRVTFQPAAVPGASFRYDTHGWGLIQLYFGSVRPDRSLTNSHTNHNSESRARKWAGTYTEVGDPSDWDWPAVERTSGRLIRYIRKIAPDKQWSRPVLPAAFKAQNEGRVKCVLFG